MAGEEHGDFAAFLRASPELPPPECPGAPCAPKRLPPPLARQTPLLPDLPGARSARPQAHD